MNDNDSDLSSLRPLFSDEAYEVVHSIASHYPTFIRIYKPDSPFLKLKPFLESRDSSEDTISNAVHSSDETDQERSLRRTRKMIKDIVLCNKFDLMATFTFGSNRQDIGLCKLRMSNWVKNEKKRKGKFKYIFVPEFHKDQQSLHFHALLQGYKGQMKQSINPKNGLPIKQGTRYVFELPSYTSGFTNAKIIDDRHDSLTKVGFYIQKYITKDMPVFANKNRYWASHGLLKPIIEHNPPEWYLSIEPDREYKNEYGTILEFDARNHPLVSLFHKEAN